MATFVTVDSVETDRQGCGISRRSSVARYSTDCAKSTDQVGWRGMAKTSVSSFQKRKGKNDTGEHPLGFDGFSTAFGTRSGIVLLVLNNITYSLQVKLHPI